MEAETEMILTNNTLRCDNRLFVKRVGIIFLLFFLASGLMALLYFVSLSELIELMELHRISPLSKPEVVVISKNTVVILLTYGFIPGVITGCACSLLSKAIRSRGRSKICITPKTGCDEDFGSRSE